MHRQNAAAILFGHWFLLRRTAARSIAQDFKKRGEEEEEGEIAQKPNIFGWNASIHLFDPSCFSDPPRLVTRPKAETESTAGEEVLLECQARGDPHPGIVWSKEGEGQEIDLERADVVHGKGLR